MIHRDALSRRMRTWPYGTQKRVKVIHIETSVLVVSDEKDEGFILAGEITDGVCVGDTGSITFTEGGPLGGFLKFAKEGGQT